MSSVNSHHRQCKPIFNKDDENSSDGDDSKRDPFHTSDNENDLDYQLPKKAKVLKKSNKILERKKLTPRERLARLNRKIQSKQNSSNGLTTHMSSNQIELASSNNENGHIDTQKNVDNQMKSTEAKVGDVSCSFLNSYDHLFDSNEISHGSVVKEEPETNEISSNSEMSKAILDLVLGLRDGMNEMACNFNSLRKQVSRLEMKTLGTSSPHYANNQMCIQPDLLLDFDATLANEGLPISTCIELNDFELKLRQDVKYREKLVRFFIKFYISYFILFKQLFVCLC